MMWTHFLLDLLVSLPDVSTQESFCPRLLGPLPPAPPQHTHSLCSTCCTVKTQGLVTPYKEGSLGITRILISRIVSAEVFWSQPPAQRNTSMVQPSSRTSYSGGFEAADKEVKVYKSMFHFIVSIIRPFCHIYCKKRSILVPFLHSLNGAKQEKKMGLIFQINSYIKQSEDEKDLGSSKKVTIAPMSPPPTVLGLAPVTKRIRQK